MYGQNDSARTIVVTTAATYRFPDTEIPNGDIADFILELTGANNSLDNALTDVRVKLSGTPIIDCTGPQLRTLCESLYPSNTVPAAGRLSVTVPCSLPGFADGSVGLPVGVKPSVEIVVSAGSSAGTATIGWRTLNGRKPSFLPRFISFAGNVAASTNRQRINLNNPNELIYGISVPVIGATGITRMKVVLGGATVFELSRLKYLEAAAPVNPQTVITPFFVRMPILLPAPTGNSFIEVDSGVGTAATDQWALYTLEPLK